MRLSKFAPAYVFVPLVLLATAESAHCQITSTQCNINTAFTAVGVGTGYDNRNLYCNSWTLQWWASPGVTALSIEIDSAQDPGTGVSPPAGSFSIASQSINSAGANPSSGISGIIVTTFSAPWVAVRLNSLTGSGTVNYILRGLNSPTQQVSTAGGSGSSVAHPVIAYHGTPPASFTIPSSGQSLHQLYLILTNSVGHTCVAADGYFSIVLIGANGTPNPALGPGSNSIEILDTQIFGTAGGGNSTGPYYGYGSFTNYLIAINSAAGAVQTDCLLDIFYVGFNNASPLAAISSVGFGPTPKQVGITQCSNQNHVSVATGTSSVLASGAVLQASNLIVCSVTAATATAATTFKLFFATTGSSCVTAPFDLISTWPMAVGVPVTFGSNLGNYFILSNGEDICGTATGGTVVYSITFDYR